MYLKNNFIYTAKKILIIWPKTIIRFFSFLKEYTLFRKVHKRSGMPVAFKNIYPCLKDKITSTPFDQHYIYHPAWAARILAQIRPALHVDISSILSFSTIVSAFVPVKFYDYRPAQLHLNNLQSDFADLIKLPFENNYLQSLSCMHTIEHVGLGRYGDPLDAEGDIKAINELQRVAKQGGTILFVTPVGQPRIEFNAHRVYSFEQIVSYFSNCKLQEFSLIPDAGGLLQPADPALVQQQQYGCGCFWFIKE
jgi:SAM-dependent methyltransferase